MRKEPDEAELLQKVLGPTKKLRAPTVIVGKTMLAGWCEPAWKEFFGKPAQPVARSGVLHGASPLKGI